MLYNEANSCGYTSFNLIIESQSVYVCVCFSGPANPFYTIEEKKKNEERTANAFKAKHKQIKCSNCPLLFRFIERDNTYAKNYMWKNDDDDMRESFFVEISQWNKVPEFICWRKRRRRRGNNSIVCIQRSAINLFDFSSIILYPH